VRVVRSALPRQAGGSYNITTVADLVQCRLSDLRDWYNFGKASRSCLGERLRAFGLNLAEQHDHTWIRTPINRKPQRLDRVLILPTFDLDQGYSQDHVIRALSAIADVTAPGLWGSTRTLSLAAGSQYGLNVICNRTHLDAMTVRRLFRDLVAKGLVDESTQGTFKLAPNGRRLVQQVERQAAEQANAEEP
jgi:predicted transcriptional regulator